MRYGLKLKSPVALNFTKSILISSPENLFKIISLLAKLSILDFNKPSNFSSGVVLNISALYSLEILVINWSTLSVLEAG
ncbi:MAG: hypothetical protein H6613_00820 [Ignavibacteriales bacterium]|nr:hypothetical protein [Ignavibacteriales bacterium]